MYVPSAFRVDDFEKVATFIERHSFATLATQDAEGPFATHLPTLYDRERGAQGTLIAHMARANPQWRHFASGNRALAIFHGPHGYVSPSWYRSQPAVPTWNYAVVHAYGVPVVIDDRDRVVALLDRTVGQYEAGFERPWPGAPADYRDKLVEAIVAFEMPIDRLEGKFKLNQNRSADDRQGVFDALSRAPDESSRGVAELMLEEGLVERASFEIRRPRRNIAFAPTCAGDFEELADLRLFAMRESLESLGRFDPERSRERLRRSFDPEHARHILVDGCRAGFYALRPSADELYLDHLYVHPLCQSQGVGSYVLQHLLSQADAAGKPVILNALRGSRANDFYARHGFEKTAEDELDVYYRRLPAQIRSNVETPTGS